MNSKKGISTGTKYAAVCGFMLGVFGLFSTAPEVAHIVRPMKDASFQMSSKLVEGLADVFTKKNQDIVVQNVFPVAKADVIPAMSVEELERKLDEAVWGDESQHRVMNEGELLQVFDPADNELAACTVRRMGKEQPEYCISWGPRQIKMAMIKTYWPQLHNGEKLTDAKALEIANSNEGSRAFFLECAEKISGCANLWTGFRNHKEHAQVYLDLIREVKGIKI